jgi:hypothetical protein
MLSKLAIAKNPQLQMSGNHDLFGFALSFRHTGGLPDSLSRSTHTRRCQPVRAAHRHRQGNGPLAQ